MDLRSRIIRDQQRIIRRLERENERLRCEARVDSLTGLANRRGTEEAIERAAAQVQRLGHPHACIVLDLDHFKLVNDRHGHAAGDEVLRRVGALVRKRLRGTDTGGRWGGEELVVIHQGTLDGAVTLAERLRQDIERQTYVGADGPFQVTASLGVAEADGSGAMFSRADAALYRAKAGGRNAVETA